MRNLFGTETKEAMLKLISKQGEMIDLLKEAIKEKDEIISIQKKLVKIMQQEIDLAKQKHNHE